jgi:hypothetical protein
MNELYHKVATKISQVATKISQVATLGKPKQYDKELKLGAVRFVTEERSPHSSREKFGIVSMKLSKSSLGKSETD